MSGHRTCCLPSLEHDHPRRFRGQRRVCVRFTSRPGWTATAAPIHHLMEDAATAEIARASCGSGCTTPDAGGEPHLDDGTPVVRAAGARLHRPAIPPSTTACGLPGASRRPQTSDCSTGSPTPTHRFRPWCERLLTLPAPPRKEPPAGRRTIEGTGQQPALGSVTRLFRRGRGPPARHRASGIRWPRLGAEKHGDRCTKEDRQRAQRDDRQPAMQQVKAGLKGHLPVPAGGVAADANLAGAMYPDQSLYPANSVPQVRQSASTTPCCAPTRSHSRATTASTSAADRGRRRGQLRRRAQWTS